MMLAYKKKYSEKLKKKKTRLKKRKIKHKTIVQMEMRPLVVQL